jgi:hypothetical protein
MKLLFILPGYKVVFLLSLPRTMDRMRQNGSVVSTITNATPEGPPEEYSLLEKGQHVA